ncbi:MAG TPA: PQQ-like beta-propeller repeat protein [Kiritimatiellia bacterium]|nr:PQQ-like beta-propeller repeat protein [Kiritimatiellia bacterium]HPS08901.1 PQQ-like beta-propeller repeat protein [Kiritimatiellia bacterium]
MFAKSFPAFTLPAVLLSLCAELHAADWPTFLGAKRDGCSPDTGLLKQWPQEGPKLLWKSESIGPGWSSVAVVGGCVYTTGNAGEDQMLICLDEKSGKEKWRAAQGPKSSHNKYGGARATPTVDGGRIYLTGGDGLLTCQSAQDGRILWKKDLRRDFGGKVGGWQYAESVLILGKLAIATPGGQHAVVAFDKVTGNTAWKSDKPATAGYSSCVPVTLNGSTVIVNGSQSGLFVVDAKTGKELCRHPFADGNVANSPTPAYADGRLFWAVGYNKGGICLKIANGSGKVTCEEAWTTRDFACHPGNYVVSQGRIYGKGKGGLVCADLKTGQTLWQERGGAGQATWADGMIYSLADSGGRLTLIDPSDEGNRVKGRLQVAGTGNSWSHPVVVNGQLYVRYDTSLYCFDVKAK